MISAACASGVDGGSDGSPVVEKIEISERAFSRMIERHELRDHPAHRGARDMRAFDAERVEQPRRIRRHVVERVRDVRLAAFAQRLAAPLADPALCHPISALRPTSRLSKVIYAQACIPQDLDRYSSGQLVICEPKPMIIKERHAVLRAVSSYSSVDAVRADLAHAAFAFCFHAGGEIADLLEINAAPAHW